MQNLTDVFHHLIDDAHFRSEEDKNKAHDILTAATEENDQPDANPEKERENVILSPDGTQRWTGSSWEPVPIPENPDLSQGTVKAG